MVQIHVKTQDQKIEVKEIRLPVKIFNKIEGMITLFYYFFFVSFCIIFFLKKNNDQRMVHSQCMKSLSPSLDIMKIRLFIVKKNDNKWLTSKRLNFQNKLVNSIIIPSFFSSSFSFHLSFFFLFFFFFFFFLISYCSINFNINFKKSALTQIQELKIQYAETLDIPKISDFLPLYKNLEMFFF